MFKRRSLSFLPLLCVTLVCATNAVAAGGGAEIEIFTDSEGRYDQIQALIDDGVLRVDSAGELDIVDPKTVLVFNGDLCDRGPNCRKMLKQLNGLKDRYPERFIAIMGNRDLNKLSYPYFRQDLTTDPALRERYRAFLQSRTPGEVFDEAAFRSADHSGNRILFWAQEFGLLPAIENHQAELKAEGKALSLVDAAADFEKLITDPNGEYFKFVSRGQLAAEVEGWTFVHGGLPATKGFVPEESKIYKTFDSWSTAINGYYSKYIEMIRRTAAGTPDPKARTFMEFGDALYDRGVKQIWNQDNSTIYAPRYRENGNFRSSQEEADWLKASGKKGLIVGHQPAGQVPQPQDMGDFLKVYADTSYTENGKRTRISIKENTVRIQGKLKDGTPVDFKVRPGDQGPIGKVIDGKTVVARTKDGRYVEFHYEGFNTIEEYASASELKDAKLVSPAVKLDEVAETQKGNLFKGLKERGIRIYESTTTIDDVLMGRTPVGFMSSSTYVDATQSAAGKRMIESELDALDPAKTVIFTGATDKGAEQFVHDLAKKKGFTVYGLVVSAALPGEVSGNLDAVFYVGSEWKDQPIAMMDLIKAKGGFATALGGGGVLREGLDYGEKIGASVLYARNITHGNGARSASMDFGRKFPMLAFEDGDGLRRIISKYGYTNMRKKVAYLTPEQSMSSIRSRGKKVVTFIGFSGAEYENVEAFRTRVRLELSYLDPKKFLISSGGTPEGIGLVYEEAKKMGFNTFAQVSDSVNESWLSGFVDEAHIIKSKGWGGFVDKSRQVLDGVSKASVNSTDIAIVLGGGAVGRDEASMLIKKGVPVRAFAFEMNHAVAKKKAAKAIPPKPEPTDFVGDVEKTLLTGSRGPNGQKLFNFDEKLKKFYCEKLISK